MLPSLQSIRMRCRVGSAPLDQNAMPSNSTGTTVSNANAGRTQNTRGKSRRTGTVRARASARRRTSARTSCDNAPATRRRCAEPCARPQHVGQGLHRWSRRAGLPQRDVERRAQRGAAIDAGEHGRDCRRAPLRDDTDGPNAVQPAPTATPSGRRRRAARRARIVGAAGPPTRNGAPNTRATTVTGRERTMRSNAERRGARRRGARSRRARRARGDCGATSRTPHATIQPQPIASPHTSRRRSRRCPVARMRRIHHAPHLEPEAHDADTTGRRSCRRARRSRAGRRRRESEVHERADADHERRGAGLRRERVRLGDDAEPLAQRRREAVERVGRPPADLVRDREGARGGTVPGTGRSRAHAAARRGATHRIAVRASRARSRRRAVRRRSRARDAVATVPPARSSAATRSSVWAPRP